MTFPVTGECSTVELTPQKLVLRAGIEPALSFRTLIKSQLPNLSATGV